MLSNKNVGHDDGASLDAQLAADPHPVKKPSPCGRKGKETRRTLMDATRKLLAVMSPLSITAVAISREANTSPATFYVYFNDVEDILWALCEAVTLETSHLFINHAFLRDEARLEDDALAFACGYCDIWAQHGPLLLYRNMEADRGNSRFNQLVMRVAMPILEALADRIVEGAPADKPIGRMESRAEAVVFPFLPSRARHLRRQ